MCPPDPACSFGLPGETEATLAETIEFVRSLPPRSRFPPTGARVYPHTPLAALAREGPELLFGADDPSFFEPVVFSALGPPRDLARRLKREFADLPHVRAAGVGFASGRQTVARAYRVATGAAPATTWQDVLDEAERAGDYQRTPGESLAAVMQIALWHERLDLGTSAATRLLRFRGALPDGLTRRRVRLVRLRLTAHAARSPQARSAGDAEAEPVRLRRRPRHLEAKRLRRPGRSARASRRRSTSRARSVTGPRRAVPPVE